MQMYSGLSLYLKFLQTAKMPWNKR